MNDDHVARRLLVAGALAALLVPVIYLVMVHTATGQRLDNAALLGAEQQGLTSENGSADGLRRITADSFALVLALIVAFGLLRRRLRLGVSVAVAAAVSVLVTDALRRVLLDRPLLVHSDQINLPNTFPSGHTATAFACALAIVVVSPPTWRGVSAVLAGSYAWITAAAVQTAGWHRPSDAIGAAFLAFAVVSVVSAGVAARRPVGTGRRIGHLPSFAILGAVWLYAATVASLNAVRVLRFLHDHSDSVTPTPTPAILTDAYHFSLNLTIVIVVSLLAALLLLLGPADLDQPRRAASPALLGRRAGHAGRRSGTSHQPL